MRRAQGIQVPAASCRCPDRRRPAQSGPWENRHALPGQDPGCRLAPFPAPGKRGQGKWFFSFSAQYVPAYFSLFSQTAEFFEVLEPEILADDPSLSVDEAAFAELLPPCEARSLPRTFAFCVDPSPSRESTRFN